VEETIEYSEFLQRLGKEEAMETATAVFRDGRIELAEPVAWPNGTRVRVTRLGDVTQRVDWLSLPPLQVGDFRELSAEDDLLAEMLDDARA